ncbi:MAG: glycosyltransferase family 4 protein [Pseudomonadota bacterium]
MVAGDILKYPEEGNTRILAMADIVTAPSAYTLQGIADRIGPQAQVHSIPYGVDTRRFDVEHVADNDVFTIVARANTVRKGGHLVLEAILRCHQQWARAIHPRRLQIVILGSCEPQLAELYGQARRVGSIAVRDGDVPNADVPALFARCDLLVMPTLSEGMSLACVEAMRAGVPLVITAYAGLDCFVDGEMGLRVEDSVESVGDAVTRVLTHPAQLERWRTNVREAAQGLTWGRYEAAIAAVATGCAT